jgi:hypothetical protein
MKVYNTASEAYLGTLKDVLLNYDFKSSPRNQPIREKLDYTFRVLNPDSKSVVTLDPDRNSVIDAYSNKEKELYGRNN